VVGGLPAGLGEPFWDSVESRISHAVFSIPGVRGIEFGDGFQASRMKGSEHNDLFPEHECCHGEGHECHHGEGGCHGEGHECHHGEGGCNGEGHECHHGEGEGCGHGGGCCHGGGNHIEAPLTNHAGGINGGITNGNPIVFRVAFKPTASIAKSGIPGRHDTCFALRTPVIVEAMSAITLVDLWKTV
jgi:chorismate synthase